MGKKRTSKANANPWPVRVQNLLDAYELTHEQLGSRLGVSRSGISTFLSGYRVPPRPVQKLIAMMEAGDSLSRFEKV